MEQNVEDIVAATVKTTTLDSVDTNDQIVADNAPQSNVSLENGNTKNEESITRTDGSSINGSNTTENNDTSKNTEENVDDITDAMIENLQDNFIQDVDGMVSLMESAEEFMFESDDKQLNIKAAIEANKNKKEQETKSAINSDKSEAYSLLAQGKRNLFVKDYESAVTTLGEACQKLSSIYGDFAVELADAYMTYGNALLELWRVEEADKKNNEGENAEIGENVEEENHDENDSVAEEKDPNDSATKSDENKENEDGDDDKEDEDNEEKNEDGEEDIENEDDNIQIAWEVVELAKEIYIRHNDNVNVAKAYLKLAEISIASGNYALAIEDLNRSLDIQKNISPIDNRLKANTHFNLYVAYSASLEYDKSAEQLDTAKSVFETQVHDLNQKLKTVDKNNVSEITKITKEISDTEEIMKDMDSKVLENNKHKRELMTALLEAIKKKPAVESSPLDGSTSDPKAGASTGKSLPVPTTSSVPVNNISHLIHKKPKQRNEPSVDKNHSQCKLATSNGESSHKNKIITNCDSEHTDNITIANEKRNSQDINERKRKLSESGDSSPKKACLEHE